MSDEFQEYRAPLSDRIFNAILKLVYWVFWAIVGLYFLAQIMSGVLFEKLNAPASRADLILAVLLLWSTRRARPTALPLTNKD